MDNLGSVGRQGHALIAVLFRDHFKNAAQFGECFFTAGHQGVTTGYSGNLGHPRAIFLPVENRLVILDAHGLPSSIPRLYWDDILSDVPMVRPISRLDIRGMITPMKTAAGAVPSVPPSSDAVRAACAEFDDEYAVTEQALHDLFKQYPRNDRQSHVLLKVVALNRLYSCGILAVHDVAGHIYQQAGDVDRGLAGGSADIVDKIAKVTIVATGKQRNFWAFATKYCSWHNLSTYPIWDSRVAKYLRSLQGTPFSRPDDWTRYQDFVNLMSRFREHYGLGSFTFKEIDKFLWLHGGEKA